MYCFEFDYYYLMVKHNFYLIRGICISLRPENISDAALFSLSKSLRAQRNKIVCRKTKELCYRKRNINNS